MGLARRASILVQPLMVTVHPAGPAVSSSRYRRCRHRLWSRCRCRSLQALPGSTFFVAAPGGGAPVQVQVPPGGVPGSTIFAQVPQAPGPVQGAVVQAVQAVPGGVELCAKQ